MFASTNPAKLTTAPTYGTARVMVSNITYDKAVQLEEQLEDIDGVDSIDFDETSDHYKDSSALFSVSFDGEVDDLANLGDALAVDDVEFGLLERGRDLVLDDLGNAMDRPLSLTVNSTTHSRPAFVSLRFLPIQNSKTELRPSSAGVSVH